jgi:peptidyl-dipeptidase A
VLSDAPPHRLVETLQERIRAAETDFHRAYWDAQVSATPETERERAQLELELRRIKGDAEALKAVEASLDTELHEPLLRRQLEVLRLSLLGNQMDEGRREELVSLASSVEADFAAYRPQVDGRRASDNEIESILTSSDDADERRTAWFASKEIGAVVAPRVRELARVRNSMAVDLGFADYYNMALELQEMSETWLFNALDRLERLTDEPFRRFKSELDAKLKERFSASELLPWHYADPFFQKLPPDGRISLDEILVDKSAAELAARTFAGWGIDLSAMLGRSDLYPRDGKSQHAFCIDIDRTGKDVRILANIAPGERWVEVMLHECGHAAYDLGIDRHLPYLVHRPAHTFVTEAIAIMAGRLIRDPEWLIEVAGVSRRDAGALEPQLRRARGTQSLLFARWGLVVCHFERSLYRDPEGDLDSVWWELAERFQLVRPPGRSAPDWAAKIHVATAPAYYHNYLLGELLASQIEETCRRDCGGLIGNAAAGTLLAERIFHPGASIRWDELVERATGRPLGIEDFASAVTR